MGLELLSPLFGKLLAGLALLVSLVAVYFGIKAKGAREERDRVQRATWEAQRAQQEKLDRARASDRAVDQAARTKIADIKRSQTPLPDAKLRPGDPFKFAVALALLFGLSACTSTPALPVSVAIDIPARPILPDCPGPPNTSGRVVELNDGLRYMQISLEDAERLRTYLHHSVACAAEREILWRAHAEKLENRLKAVSGP